MHGKNKKRPGVASAEASSKGHYTSRSSSKGAAGSKANPEITVFIKLGGPLTKRISLSGNGLVKSDGSACLMSAGAARRADVVDIQQLAALIGKLPPDQAIALGALRTGLPVEVKVVTKAKLLNGVAQPHIIARTGDAIDYREGQPAFALLDFDTKGMPPHVVAELKRLGGFWEAMLSVLPALRDVARVVRRSTSAGLFRSDTGEQLRGSDGLHVYLTVQDGSDIERFLRALHARCWLVDLGWMMLGAAGQLLERSVVDRMVGAPERLVFEGGPILVPPLQQDRESRRPVAVDGDALDTLAACPPLSITETAKLDELRAKARQRLKPEAAKAHAAFIDRQVPRIIERTGVSMAAAKRIVARQCDGILLPNVELIFDNDEFKGCTVADVLADPERFEGATLADPLEGVEYGRCKAEIMRRPDGTPWIHSFAHGRTVYQLEQDAGAVRTAMEQADNAAVVRTFIQLAAAADLDEQETEELRNLAAERSGTNKRTIATMLKAEQRKRAERRAEQERERRVSERSDPRPSIKVPALDAPWLPVMGVLNDVLAAANPPTRDMDGVISQVRKLPVPNMHAFTQIDANTGERPTTKLPPPEQWVISRMNEMECAEIIERYIDYADKDGRSVHLPMQFVKHYLQRRDDALPTLAAIAALPIVLADGALLAPDGLDRDRGIMFVIPKELRAIVPRQQDCTNKAVRKAMRFLCDEGLCDVATDYAGKCAIIAAALTVIERSLLDERPAFFVTSGRRGGGKTTLLTMLAMAVTGIKPAASAWSNNEEERRKALLSYFLYGVPYILWDNIARGSQISCPHIERSCTAKFYIDRKLGVSEAVATAASTIHFFTGNNISARGDLASRSLQIRLTVDRPDPENRDFKHPDPIGWTDDNRAEILRALYTLLLGNPQLKTPHDAPAKTRFKMWWRLVGSAVEHAAKLHAPKPREGAEPEEVDFQKLFLKQEEEEDEDSVSLVDALTWLAEMWPEGFHATDVAELLNGFSIDPGTLALREFLYPSMSQGSAVAARSVGKRLAAHVDEPVKSGECTLSLRKIEETTDRKMKGALRYRIHMDPDPKTEAKATPPKP
jgi:hypothetical protein